MGIQIGKGEKWMECSVCFSKEHVAIIHLESESSEQLRQTQSFKLCKNCRQKLLSLIMSVDMFKESKMPKDFINKGKAKIKRESFEKKLMQLSVCKKCGDLKTVDNKCLCSRLDIHACEDLGCYYALDTNGNVYSAPMLKNGQCDNKNWSSVDFDLLDEDLVSDIKKKLKELYGKEF